MYRKFKEKYIGDAAFYKKVLMIVVPMIIQNLVTNFVSLLDNIMVGQVGTEQMSGVAIVNQLMFVYYIAIFGAVSGAGIFGTQFYGKGDYKGQRHAFRFKMYACIVFALVTIVLFITAGTPLISLYLNDTGGVGDIQKALEFGQGYLRIMIIGIIPFAIGQAYISTVRETGETFVPMLASIAAVFINLVLDYMLIFGKFGAPELGVEGAAAATVVARFVELMIVVIWTHVNSSRNQFIIGAYKSFEIPADILFAIIKKGTPLMLNEFLWAAGMATISQCYAVRGLDVVTAQNISSTIANLFNTVYIQMGASIAVIVGQHLGAGRIKEAKEEGIAVGRTEGQKEKSIEIARKMLENNMDIEWGDPIDHILRFSMMNLPNSIISIQSNGDIPLSPYLPLIIGNIKKHTLREYWNAGLYRAWDYKVCKRIAKLLSSVEEMAVLQDKCKLFKDDNIYIDLIDQDLDELSLLNNVVYV